MYLLEFVSTKQPITAGISEFTWIMFNLRLHLNPWVEISDQIFPN